MQRNLLAEYLEKVLAGEASLEALLESPGHLAEAVTPCFHGLHHFLADEDIRMKDLAYRHMQEEEMKVLIQCLREGANEDRIARISFLSRSQS